MSIDEEADRRDLEPDPAEVEPTDNSTGAGMDPDARPAPPEDAPEESAG